MIAVLRAVLPVAGGEPTLFEHRNVGDAPVPGQVVGTGQTVPATADDDNVVCIAKRLCGRKVPLTLVLSLQSVLQQC